MGPAEATSSPTRSGPWRRAWPATIAAFIDADIDDNHRELLGYAIVGLGEVTARLWVSRREEAGHPSLDPTEAELLAVRLADLVWAGLRSLPGGAQP